MDFTFRTSNNGSLLALLDSLSCWYPIFKKRDSLKKMFEDSFPMDAIDRKLLETYAQFRIKHISSWGIMNDSFHYQENVRDAILQLSNVLTRDQLQILERVINQFSNRSTQLFDQHRDLLLRRKMRLESAFSSTILQKTIKRLAHLFCESTQYKLDVSINLSFNPKGCSGMVIRFSKKKTIILDPNDIRADEKEAIMHDARGVLHEACHVLLNNQNNRVENAINKLWDKYSLRPEDKQNFEEVLIRSLFPSGALAVASGLIDISTSEEDRVNSNSKLNDESLQIIPFMKQLIESRSTLGNYEVIEQLYNKLENH